MSAREITVDGVVTELPAGWRLQWIDRSAGIARARRGERAVHVLVEGSGEDWIVTLGGRRIGARVRTWRERALEEVEEARSAHLGPLEVRATLPGLVVSVPVEVGSPVEAGQPLLVVEAMKMQNQVRAPRAGRVGSVAVRPGESVAVGALLLTLE